MEPKYPSEQSEQGAQQLWQQERVYAFDPSSDKKVFSIDTPPPTVSGSLHIGHIFSYTHTDLIARYKRMAGYNVFYPMGFDDNGLATERFVEKKHEVKAYQMKRSEFIDLCLKTCHEAEKSFEHLWRRMGLSIDWTHTYSTISPSSRRIAQYSFLQLYKKGVAYRRQEPALYCTTCRTSVAQAELDSNEQPGIFNDIVFKTDHGEEVVIATTRPELLPACGALFYHPADERYIHLQGKYAIVPLFGTRVPFLADDKVDMAKGTGLVMCCTFGDQTDIYWFKKHKLPFVEVIGRSGLLTEKAGILAGLNVRQARKQIMDLLTEKQFLKKQMTIKHNVSIHERCRQDIEFLILDQWFIKVLEDKQKFIQLADQIEWVPEYMKTRYRDWVEHLGWDWCISRQRFYGIPFPLWHCVDCKQVLVAEEKDLPLDPQETPYPGRSCSGCGSHNIRPETDVMDTWNTSSLTPQINAQWPDKNAQDCIPMSMRPQAHDIIRTWAFYTIIKAYYHHQTIPWKQIVISGHVLSGKEKISKSKENNSFGPEALLAAYPADVIRYWTAQGRPGMDTAFSENQLKIGHRLVTKLWNAFRFCAPILSEQKSWDTPVIHSPLNEWLLHYARKTEKEYHAYFDAVEYHLALETLEKFFWHYFCDNYIELVKDQFFNPDKYTHDERRSTYETLNSVCFSLLQMLAPFMPHITETLYQQFFKVRYQIASLHCTEFQAVTQKELFLPHIELIDAIVELVGAVRRLKSEAQLPLNTPLDRLEIFTSHRSLGAKIIEQEPLIAGVTRAGRIELKDGEGGETVLINDARGTIACVRLS